MRQIKDARKQFDRISSDLDTALLRNADAPKNKPVLCEETERNLSGIKKSFNHTSLEYVCHINRFYLIRSHTILDMVCYIPFMPYFKWFRFDAIELKQIQIYSQSIKSFYQCGNVLVQEYDPELADISTNLTLMSSNEKKCLDQMENKQDLLRSNVII